MRRHLLLIQFYVCHLPSLLASNWIAADRFSHLLCWSGGKVLAEDRGRIPQRGLSLCGAKINADTGASSSLSKAAETICMHIVANVSRFVRSVRQSKFPGRPLSAPAIFSLSAAIEVLDWLQTSLITARLKAEGWRGKGGRGGGGGCKR